MQRAKMVLLASEGRLNKEIATKLGTFPNLVGRWRKRFGEQRLAGIERDGEQPCKACGGDGWTRTKVGNVRRRVRCTDCGATGQKPCKICRGRGKIPCRRCNATGKRDVSVNCPVGERGRMTCPDCGSAGRKQAMTKASRLAAELAAARWAEPDQP